MAEVTVKRLGELARGILSVLVDASEEVPASKVLSLLETRVPPTEFEKTYYEKSPNTRRYEKIGRFATIGPVKAGWLAKSKGQWSVTDGGRAAYAEFTDPEAFQREATRLYRAWKKGQPQPVEPAPDVLEAESASTLEESEEAAAAEIRDYSRGRRPMTFRHSSRHC